MPQSEHSPEKVKRAAKRLKKSLEEVGVDIQISKAQDACVNLLGFKDWHQFLAKDVGTPNQWKRVTEKHDSCLYQSLLYRGFNLDKDAIYMEILPPEKDKEPYNLYIFPDAGAEHISLEEAEYRHIAFEVETFRYEMKNCFVGGEFDFSTFEWREKEGEAPYTFATLESGRCIVFSTDEQFDDAYNLSCPQGPPFAIHPDRDIAAAAAGCLIMEWGRQCPDQCEWYTESDECEHCGLETYPNIVIHDPGAAEIDDSFFWVSPHFGAARLLYYLSDLVDYAGYTRREMLRISNNERAKSVYEFQDLLTINRMMLEDPFITESAWNQIEEGFHLSNFIAGSY